MEQRRAGLSVLEGGAYGTKGPGQEAKKSRAIRTGWGRRSRKESGAEEAEQ